jgi:hypothetical protein
MLALFGCSSFLLKDCPEDGVLGVDKPRIRSWRIRTLIDDKAAAADRFVDYAAMSAYAYAVPANQDCGKERKLMPDDERELLKRLKNAGWERVIDAEYAPSCEDDVGLFYHVWKREAAEKTEVIIAFRGTWGFKDWWYGNSYWVRRFFTDKHQYTAARIYAEKVIQNIKKINFTGKVLEFSSTGHSLGGGLAQAVFYDHANTSYFKQSYAFDPSPATAYTSRRDKSPFATCDSNRELAEPRIYRIYESYEILSSLRIFHKLVFLPEPWINEVRFNYNSGDNPIAQHSMARFALRLMKEKPTTSSKKDGKPWYSSEYEECTAKFQESQSAACNAKYKEVGCR